MGKGSKHRPNELKVKLDWVSSPYDPLLSQKDDLPEVFFKAKNINELCSTAQTESQRLLLHQLILQFLEGHSDYPFYLSDKYGYGQHKPRMLDLSQVLVRRGSLAFHVHKEDFSYVLQPAVEVDEERYFLKDIREKSILLDYFMVLKEREARVNRFQEDEEVRVFLVSLKAGGTGLNLTAADYVYILDPWWNPATENQAIDRCYRMGQKKNVFAYRMICKDTVEEKIIELQEAKKKVSRDLIGEGDSILASLDKERLLALFE